MKPGQFWVVKLKPQYNSEIQTCLVLTLLILTPLSFGFLLKIIAFGMYCLSIATMFLTKTNCAPQAS